MNTKIYQLARCQLPPRDLATVGIRDVNDLFDNGFNGVTGFTAGLGYDQSTGWGTVDVDTFARKFVALSPTPTSTPPQPGRRPNADAQADGDPYRDAQADADAYSDAQADADSYTDAQADADSYTDAQADADPYGDAQADADPYCDA